MEIEDDAEQLFYIKLLKWFLWFVGGWPEERLGRQLPLLIRIHRVTLPLLAALVFIGIVNYLMKRSSYLPFFDIGHLIITMLITIMTVARAGISNFKGYGDTIALFLNDFHLIKYKTKDEYYKKVYGLLDKFSNYVSMFQCSMIMVNLVLFTVTPLCLNYNNGAFRDGNLHNMSLQHAVYFDLFNYESNDNFYITSCLNFYFTYNSSVVICCLDLLVILMVFQIIGHIQVLKHQMETLPRPQDVKYLKFEGNDDGEKRTVSVEIFSLEENYGINNDLIDIVKHHQQIVRFAEELSTVFGPVLALNYLFALTIGCILLLELSRKDLEATARYGPTAILLMGQLIEISSIFEMVNYMSEKLVDAVYCVPWECMNVSNRRSVRFILSRIQTPIQVTAMGIVPVGVQTMGGVLKGIMSYYAILKSINED